MAEDGTTNLVTLLLEHNSIANTAANATALQALSDAGTNIDIAIPDVDVNAAPLTSENIPAETLLLTNYPNPFNPETWIPYHLANHSRCADLNLRHQRCISTSIGFGLSAGGVLHEPDPCRVLGWSQRIR